MQTKPLYVKLSIDDRAQLNRLAAASGVQAGRPVGVSAVVRQLIRDAAARGRPVRVEPARAD